MTNNYLTLSMMQWLKILTSSSLLGEPNKEPCGQPAMLLICLSSVVLPLMAAEQPGTNRTNRLCKFMTHVGSETIVLSSIFITLSLFLTHTHIGGSLSTRCIILANAVSTLMERQSKGYFACPCNNTHTHTHTCRHTLYLHC